MLRNDGDDNDNNNNNFSGYKAGIPSFWVAPFGILVLGIPL